MRVAAASRPCLHQRAAAAAVFAPQPPSFPGAADAGEAQFPRPPPGALPASSPLSPALATKPMAPKQGKTLAELAEERRQKLEARRLAQSAAGPGDFSGEGPPHPPSPPPVDWGSGGGVEGG